jgi:hypothetical protein
MRLPRFTTRRLMALVAAAGAVFGLTVNVQRLLRNDETVATLIFVTQAVAITSMFVGTFGFGVVLLLSLFSSLLIKIGDTVLNRLRIVSTPERSRLPVPPARSPDWT